MVAITQRDLPYLVLTYDPNLQAYRTDRVANVEPVCPRTPTGTSSATRLSYAPLLTIAPAAGSSGESGGGGSAGLAIAGGDRRRDRRLVLRDRARGAGASASRWSSRNEARGVSGRWLAGKVARGAADVAFVLVFNFFLFRVMGDPTTQLARLPQSTPQEIEQLRHDYGLDKPLIGQFADYVGDTARLDLGLSQRSRQPVWDEIKDALPWTLLLVGRARCSRP